MPLANVNVSEGDTLDRPPIRGPPTEPVHPKCGGVQIRQAASDSPKNATGQAAEQLDGAAKDDLIVNEAS